MITLADGVFRTIIHHGHEEICSRRSRQGEVLKDMHQSKGLKMNYANEHIRG